MRIVALGALLAVSIFAKDNYIFDYKADPLLGAKIERLEREIGELKANDIELKQALANQPKPSVDLNPLQRQIDQLKRELQAQKSQKPVASKAIKNDSSRAEIAAVEQNLELLNLRIDQLKSKDNSQEIAKLSKQIALLGERATAVEIANRQKQVQNSSHESDMPFSDYFVATKAQIEYGVLGFLIFIALSFLLTIIALGKASRAEAKVQSIVKLYQSGSRKIEEKK